MVLSHLSASVTHNGRTTSLVLARRALSRGAGRCGDGGNGCVDCSCRLHTDDAVSAQTMQFLEVGDRGIGGATEIPVPLERIAELREHGLQLAHGIALRAKFDRF